jgi:hypothetical protein
MEEAAPDPPDRAVFDRVCLHVLREHAATLATSVAVSEVYLERTREETRTATTRSALAEAVPAADLGLPAPEQCDPDGVTWV